MSLKTTVLGALGALATLGAGPGASAGGQTAEAPPRVLAFSPATARPGDDFLVDVEMPGGRRPRLWVGTSRVPIRRMTVASGSRRLYARVPKRLAAGSHAITVGTRAGKAAAAKPIQVGSCLEEPFVPGDCATTTNIPDTGVLLLISGSGYARTINLPDSIVPGVGVGRTNLFATNGFFFGDQYSVTLDRDIADLHEGSVPAVVQQYHDATSGDWKVEPSPSVHVVEEEPDRIGLCVDVELTGGAPGGGGEGGEGEPGPDRPRKVRVRGYMNVNRAVALAPECGDIPDEGAKLTIAGAGGFENVLEQTTSVTAAQGVTWQAGIQSTELNAIGRFKDSFGFVFSQSPAEMHVGVPVPTVFISYGIQPDVEDGLGQFWNSPLPVAPVHVLEETVDRVRLCFHVVLTANGAHEVPREVTLKGYLVLTR